MRNSKAFTLIEIIVAVALVAILSAAIAPSVLNNIAMGRIARAQSDVQAIAAAIMKFKQEVGQYPNKKFPEFDPTTPANFLITVKFLASRGPITMISPDVGNNDGHWAFSQASTVPNDSKGFWEFDYNSGFSSGSVEDFYSHLMLGKSLDATGSDLYYRIPAGKENDPAVAGFRSGVITSDPLDPWGNRYMCNAAGLGTVKLSGELENVWVISAGPNKLFETYVASDGLSSTEVLGGDDIGVKIQ